MHPGGEDSLRGLWASLNDPLYKGIGRANLSWNELEEVLLNVEVTLNNRPLCCVEEDVQLPVLTPSTMMFGQSKVIPEEDLDEEDADLRFESKIPSLL